jgi:hypothetical protein
VTCLRIKEIYLMTDLVEGEGKLGAALTLEDYLKSAW